MANTRSSRHGKRRRQACGLDLSPREVGHEDRSRVLSCACDLCTPVRCLGCRILNIGCDLVIVCRVCFQIHACNGTGKITCISHVTKLDSVTMSADT